MSNLGSLVSSMSLAAESAWCSLSASTGAPDTSGLSFQALNDLQRSSIGYAGQETPTVPVQLAHSGLGEFPPLPVTRYSGGVATKRRVGSPVLTFQGLQCPGAGNTVASLALAKILRSSMYRVGISAATEDTVAAGSPTVNTWTATDASKYAVGYVVAVTINGRVEYVVVSDKTGSDITVSPALSGAPSVGDTIRICETYVPTLGALSMVTHPSVCLRQDLYDLRFEAVGCRLKNLKISMDGSADGPAGTGRMLMPEATLWSPWVLDDNGSAAPSAISEAGPYATALQSYDVYCSLAAASTPAAGSRIALQVAKWEASIDFDLKLRSTAGNATGGSAYYMNGVGLTLTTEIAEDSTIEAAQQTRERFTLVLGAGPTSTGNSGRGMGFALVVKAAHVVNYERVVSVDKRFARVTWGLSPYGFDTGSWAPGSHVDAPFCLAWVT